MCSPLVCRRQTIVPDYPSAHASAGGTAAAIIDAIIPGNGRAFSAVSTSLPEVTRTFRTVRDAAAKNALSRLLVGYYFRLATEVGLTQGSGVGEYVATHALRARR